MSLILTPGARVQHANRLRSYGIGEVTVSNTSDPATAKVKFRGEIAPRLVRSIDLTPETPTLRIVYPAPAR